jgi:hypothetical protein
MSSTLGLGNSEWQELYKAALFEDDSSKLPARIADAESAIIARGRTLFHRTENRLERQALERSLHFLRMLRYCSQSRPAA